MRVINQSIINKPLILKDEVVVIGNLEGDVIIDASIDIVDCKSVVFVAKNNIYQNAFAKITISNSDVQFLSENAFFVAGNITVRQGVFKGHSLNAREITYRDSDFLVINSALRYNILEMTHLAGKKVVGQEIKNFDKNTLRPVESQVQYTALPEESPRGFIPSFSQKSKEAQDQIRKKIFAMVKGKEILSNKKPEEPENDGQSVKKRRIGEL